MDVKQQITDRIISLLDGGKIKIRELWASAEGMPHNANTREPYRGVNVLMLLLTVLENNYKSNAWLTYKQAKQLGGQVRKGEQGTMCVFFDMIEKKNKCTETEAEYFPMCKPFWLFNIEQIDDLPDEIMNAGEINSRFEACEAGELIAATCGANIEHGHGSAFYVPFNDIVCMPNKERFYESSSYYAVLLHELVHWTGHSSRLDRGFASRFGENAKAMEELVAELGASFLCGHIGLMDKTESDHACYIQSWLQVFKNDKNAIFTAAKQAGLAYEYLITKAGLNQNNENSRAAA